MRKRERERERNVETTWRTSLDSAPGAHNRHVHLALVHMCTSAKANAHETLRVNALAMQALAGGEKGK